MDHLPLAGVPSGVHIEPYRVQARVWPMRCDAKRDLAGRLAATSPPGAAEPRPARPRFVLSRPCVLSQIWAVFPRPGVFPRFRPRLHTEARRHGRDPRLHGRAWKYGFGPWIHGAVWKHGPGGWERALGCVSVAWRVAF